MRSTRRCPPVRTTWTTACRAWRSWACTAFLGNPGQGPEGFEPRGHLFRAVGVQRAHPALVPRVQRSEQLADLCPTHLAHDEPVGSHPQCLPHEVDEGHGTDALDVRATTLQPDDVGVARVELPDVLDDDDPLSRPALGEQAREHGGLAGSGAARDDERDPPCDEPAQGHGEVRSHRTQPHQLVDATGVVPCEPQAEVWAPVGEGRQHGVESDTTGKHAVDPRLGVVESATGEPGQPYGEGAQVGHRHAPERRARRPAPGRPRPRRPR